ncbi:MAG TPA: hypothetical protein VMJ52_19605 [Xanthobacteraceae bacterium]|nr:hypothetical protein [Xanthobacteraceae bacterium]
MAVILDLMTLFLGGGYLIALAAGQTTGNGFNLKGAPALLLIAIIAVYFFVLRRYAGGTLWDRILGIKRPQPP